MLQLKYAIKNIWREKEELRPEVDPANVVEYGRWRFGINQRLGSLLGARHIKALELQGNVLTAEQKDQTKALYLAWLRGCSSCRYDENYNDFVSVGIINEVRYEIAGIVAVLKLKQKIT
jgi:hypothetical protein